ncbi:MAG: hypothetical protein Q4A41_06360, partial [Bacillota bacterium]|nr:hypothetical protein [Bacillota bacterium]
LVGLTLMGEVSLTEMWRMDYSERVRCVYEILKKKTLGILEKVWIQKVMPLLDSSCRIYPELPFVLAVDPDSEMAREMTLKTFGTEPERFLVRGKMDLVLKNDVGEFTVCDFKTNVKTGGVSIEAFRHSLREKYRYQMKLYTQAIMKLYDVPAGKVGVLIIDLY